MSIELATTATDQAQSVEERIVDALYTSGEEDSTGGDAEPVNEDLDPNLEDDAPETEDDELEDDSEDEADATTDEDGDDEALSLADYLGVPEDRVIVGDDGEVKILAKIDGEISEVGLKSLVKSYQLEKHVNNKSEKLEDERRGFEGQRNEAVTELRDYADRLSALSQVMEQELFTEFNSINWDTLRHTNPAEWAAKREEYALRAQHVKARQSEMVDAVKQLQAQQKQELDALRATSVTERDKALVEAFPEWHDDVVKTKALDSLGAFVASEYGMSEDAIDNTLDANAIRLAMDAKAYRQGKQTAAAKKAKPIPKFQKSGAARASAANLATARAAKGKKAALKKSGGIQDAANLLLDRM